MNSGIQTQDVRKQLGLGYQALLKGHFETAAKIVKLVLESDKKLAPAHFLIGLIAVKTNEINTAFSAFKSVVGLDNHHAGGWAQLAHLYMKFGMVNKSEKAIQQLRLLRSDEPMVLDLMGQTLTLMGEHTLANKCFARTCSIEPSNQIFMHNLANNLIFSGDTDEAEKLFNRIIELQQDSPQAHWALAGAKKAKDTVNIETMRRLAEQNGSNQQASAFYHYAIGKQYEDLQQWSDAFDAFEQGAKAKRSVTPYVEQDEIDAFNYLQEHFTEAWLSNGSESCSDASPIFVLGQPRTGTTLIERVISAHTDVHSAGELQQFRLALLRLGNVNSNRRFSTETFAAAKRVSPKKIGNMYLQMVGRMRGETVRFVDKLPQNYMFLPLILKALPNAKIIHLVRDPMDACFASYKQLFSETYAHSYEQQEMARHHIRYLKLMEVWRERFGERFYDISYEQTARDLQTNAKALIGFLELPWQQSCLNFHQQTTAVRTASAVQVREPVHTRSIGRWRRYEEQLQPMLKTLQSAGVRINS